MGASHFFSQVYHNYYSEAFPREKVQNSHHSRITAFTSAFMIWINEFMLSLYTHTYTYTGWQADTSYFLLIICNIAFCITIQADISHFFYKMPAILPTYLVPTLALVSPMTENWVFSKITLKSNYSSNKHNIHPSTPNTYLAAREWQTQLYGWILRHLQCPVSDEASLCGWVWSHSDTLDTQTGSCLPSLLPEGLEPLLPLSPAGFLLWSNEKKI